MSPALVRYVAYSTVALKVTLKLTPPSRKLSLASWLSEVVSRKLALTSWLSEVVSCKFSLASWLSEVVSLKLS